MIAIVLALVLAGCAPGATPDGKSLVLDRCGGCHSVQRVRGKVGLDASEWQIIVTRMERNGLVVTPAEKQAIVDFLATGTGY